MPLQQRTALKSDWRRPTSGFDSVRNKPLRRSVPESPKSRFSRKRALGIGDRIADCFLEMLVDDLRDRLFGS